MKKTEDKKYCVAMIFDRSFQVFNVLIGMNIIADIMYRFRDNARYIYGGIPRFEYHVEVNKRDLHLPDELFTKLEIPYTCEESGKYLTKAVVGDWAMSMLKYKPDEIHILRDNGHTNETTMLVEYAKRLHIPVYQYDCNGDMTVSCGSNSSSKALLRFDNDITKIY